MGQGGPEVKKGWVTNYYKLAYLYISYYVSANCALQASRTLQLQGSFHLLVQTRSCKLLQFFKASVLALVSLCPTKSVLLVSLKEKMLQFWMKVWSLSVIGQSQPLARLYILLDSAAPFILHRMMEQSSGNLCSDRSPTISTPVYNQGCYPSG